MLHMVLSKRDINFIRSRVEIKRFFCTFSQEAGLNFIKSNNSNFTRESERDSPLDFADQNYYLPSAACSDLIWKIFK